MPDYPYTPTQFLKILYIKHGKHENPDNILAAIRIHFEFLFKNGRDDEANEILHLVDLTKLPPHAVLEILTLTDKSFTNRPGLIARCERVWSKKYPRTYQTWMESVA